MMTKVARLQRSQANTPTSNKSRNRAHVVVTKSLNKAGNTNIMKSIGRKLHETSARLDMNRMIVIKTTQSTLNLCFETPPGESIGLGDHTSAKERKAIGKKVETRVSARNQIKVGNVNISSSSPISNIGLLALH